MVPIEEEERPSFFYVHDLHSRERPFFSSFLSIILACIEGFKNAN